MSDTLTKGFVNYRTDIIIHTQKKAQSDLTLFILSRVVCPIQKKRKVSRHYLLHYGKEMMKFYGPALGIFLAGPLMSNIDNAVVGRAAGVGALAALSPGTVLADQVLYLFSFLGRATTGLVARAYAAEGTDGARRELRRPLAPARSDFKAQCVMMLA